MRALLLMALLAAHALLLWRLQHGAAAPRAQAAVRVLAELLLIEPRRPKPETRPAPKPERPTRPAPAAAPRELQQPAPSQAPERSVSPAAPSPSPNPQVEIAPAGTAAGGGRAPLNLALPSRAASHPHSMEPNPALSDPRANTPKLTFAEKFAIAAGEYGCIVIERSPEGRYERYPGDIKDMASASGAWGSGGSANVCVRKPGSVPVR